MGHTEPIRAAVAIGVLAAAGAVSAVVVVTGPLGWGGSERPQGATSNESGATVPALADDAVRIMLDGGAERSTDTLIEVEVHAPAPADQVQIDVDPSFPEATWQPLEGDHAISVRDGGYQMVFARVRAGADGAPGPIGVAGIVVDTTWEAATASADGRPHRASWARLATPDLLKVRIEAGRVVWNGAAPDDLVIGRPLDTAPLDDPAAFRIGPGDAPAVTAVSRVSRPNGQATFGDERTIPMIHDYYLQLDRALPLGVEMVLSFAAGVEEVAFTIDDRSTVSPAVHVNQLGFRPDDAGKVAMLSEWRGAAGGVTYADGTTFEVIDTATRSNRCVRDHRPTHRHRRRVRQGRPHRLRGARGRLLAGVGAGAVPGLLPGHRVLGELRHLRRLHVAPGSRGGRQGGIPPTQWHRARPAVHRGPRGRGRSIPTTEPCSSRPCSR